MKKRILVVCSIVMLLFVLTGCGDKTAISADTFRSKMEAHDFYVSDASLQFSVYDFVENVTVAGDPSGNYQLEFYTFTTDGDAIESFQTNKSDFEQKKGSTSTEKSKNGKNFESYSLTSNGRCMYVSRVDNTMLYLDIPDSYKKEVKKIVKELGY